MTYRSDLDALAARQSALESEVAQKTRELAEATQMLADATARAKLPVLDNIRVAAPCSADWSKMTGDERVRHCGDCKKNVYNLSDMTRDEAQALIIEKEGKLCVRYFRRADGTILLKDCSIGVSRRRKRRIIAAGAAALLAGGAAVALRIVGKGDSSPVHTAEQGSPKLTPVMGGLPPSPGGHVYPLQLGGPRDEVKGEMMVEMGDVAAP